MSWLSKDLQIAILTMTDMQIQAYDVFLKKYGTQALALKHTKIYMDSLAVMMAPGLQGGKQ